MLIGVRAVYVFRFPLGVAEGLLDLLGDLPNPRRMDVSELRRLPRVEVRTTDPHDPGKEIV